MAVLLSWLLGREDLALRLVGGGDPERVEIDWVHSIELDDPTRWLQGGELVLTTGLRLPRARAEQIAYVERLAAAGTAVVGFGTGVRFDAIPAPLREACAERGLPLVEVPLPTPFVAVTRAIADRTAELQYESMQRTVTFQRRLTVAALRDGVTGVVRGLATELAAGVLVLDDRGRPVESARTASDLAERVGAELRTRTGRRRTTLRVAEDDRSIEMHSVGDRSGRSGWLAIDTAAPLTSTDRVLLNQALSLLTLLRERSRDVLELRRRVGSTVLDLLLDADPPHPAAREHLRGFGFGDDDPVSVVVCGAGSVEESAGVLDELGLPYVATNRVAGLVLLVRTEDAASFADRLRADGPGTPPGVSGELAAEDAATGLAQAVRAAESARWSGEAVGRHDTQTLAHVLRDETVRERVGTIAGSALHPLRGHPVLLESLETYLRANGSWEAAARSLGVHRHTLRNRMARVESLTGHSLDDAEHRTLLLLALMSR